MKSQAPTLIPAHGVPALAGGTLTAPALENWNAADIRSVRRLKAGLRTCRSAAYGVPALAGGTLTAPALENWHAADIRSARRLKAGLQTCRSAGPLFRLLLTFITTLFLALAPARAAEEKLDLDSVLNDKDKVIKADEAEAGPGDGKFFTIKTDDNITSLEIGDVYRNEQKTFFKVTSIASKGSQGGEFSVQRTAGRSDPDRKFQRVSGTGPVTIVSRITLLDLYIAGGFFMHPIALAGVAVILLALNCIWIYRQKAQIPPRFVEDARKALDAGDVEKFEDLALKERGLFPGICRALADRFEDSTPEEIKNRAEIAAGGLIGKLRVPTKALNLIAAAAPLLGLLGTIVGMVIVFEAVASATGAAKAQALAAGIRVKLFCTAMALTVAIPALFLYFLFNQKLSDLISQCESLSENFLHQLTLLKRKSARASGRADDEAPDAKPAAARTKKDAATGKGADRKEDE